MDFERELANLVPALQTASDCRPNKPTVLDSFTWALASQSECSVSMGAPFAKSGFLPIERLASEYNYSQDAVVMKLMHGAIQQQFRARQAQASPEALHFARPHSELVWLRTAWLRTPRAGEQLYGPC